VRFLVKEILKKNSSETTSKCFGAFIKRNPELSKRRVQALDKQRLL